jgi:putative transposase
VVDTLGLLLAVAVTGANLDDGTHAPRVLGKLGAADYPRLEVIFGDNKYHNQTLEAWLLGNGVGYRVEVATKAAGVPGFVPVKIRWVVERAIAWLGRCRRLSKDYEYLTTSSETWVQLAAIQQMTRRLRPDRDNRQPAFKYPKKAAKVA